MLSLILLVFGFVLFALAGFGISGGRFNLVGLGLAFCTLALIVARVPLVAR